MPSLLGFFCLVLYAPFIQLLPCRNAIYPTNPMLTYHPQSHSSAQMSSMEPLSSTHATYPASPMYMCFPVICPLPCTQASTIQPFLYTQTTHPATHMHACCLPSKNASTHEPIIPLIHLIGCPLFIHLSQSW